MVLVLAIGDFYVPHRCCELAQRFRELLAPGKIQHVLCTGNVCSDEIEALLRRVSFDVHIARGELDGPAWPERVVVSIEQIRFGLCHGHQVLPWSGRTGDAFTATASSVSAEATAHVRALHALRRDMGVDVLVAGMAERPALTSGKLGGLVVQPGSATGAPRVTDPWPSDKADNSCKTSNAPGFVLMDVHGSHVTLYTYVQDRDDPQQVHVEKHVFERPDPTASALLL
ncbi:hypothetical protein CDCA_CDCA04G1261 [Cyanidium caldarium]|uniref:Vacuolar protein sorting-associated protein 29 n=1 Tax=Cyanidium caldarium TaxID=2771 RepID=A0AAV9ISS6_CYACA|nr:hypothetical protein CDCA_CDCA04G1261 [Cyanidium caldarium]